MGTAHASDGTWDRAWGKDVDHPEAARGGLRDLHRGRELQARGRAAGLAASSASPASPPTRAGNVYVADDRDQRIQKFDSSGNFLRAWGKDVDPDGRRTGTGFEICTVAANCKPGTFGGGLGGELSAPAGRRRRSARETSTSPKASGSRSSTPTEPGSAPGAGTSSPAAAPASRSARWPRAASWGPQRRPGRGVPKPQRTSASTPRATSTSATRPAADPEVRLHGTWERAWGKDVVTTGGAPNGFEVCTAAADCKSGVTGGAGRRVQLSAKVATDDAGDVYVGDIGEPADPEVRLLGHLGARVGQGRRHRRRHGLRGLHRGRGLQAGGDRRAGRRVRESHRRCHRRRRGPLRGRPRQHAGSRSSTPPEASCAPGATTSCRRTGPGTSTRTDSRSAPRPPTARRGPRSTAWAATSRSPTVSARTPRGTSTSRLARRPTDTEVRGAGELRLHGCRGRLLAQRLELVLQPGPRLRRQRGHRYRATTSASRRRPPQARSPSPATPRSPSPTRPPWRFPAR